MLLRIKTETNLQDHRLFSLSELRDLTGFNQRTSSPVLDRKSLSCCTDTEEYKSFCSYLHKPHKKRVVLNKGRAMEVFDDSIITGHLITEKDLERLNEPIKEEDIRQTITRRIYSLLNGSYKKLIEKTNHLFKSKQDNVSGSNKCKNNIDSGNYCDCGCRSQGFVDLDKRRSRFCAADKANIYII